MKLSAPTQAVWLIAVILGLLGLIGYFVAIPALSANAFWLVSLGFILLTVSTLLRGF